MSAAPFTAGQLVAEVEKRYAPPEWYLDTEITLGSRRLDVVAFNLWKHGLVGFEVKVARGDWLNELDDFSKSEEWCAVVDRFYLVTSPGVVKTDELPARWGHLELVGKRMMTRRHADARRAPKTIPREIVARMFGRLIRANDNDDRNARHRIETEVREEVRARETVRIEEKYGADMARLRAESQRYRDLLRTLGLHDGSGETKVLRAAGLLAEMHGTIAGARQFVGSQAARLEATLKTLRDAEAELKAQLDE